MGRSHLIYLPLVLLTMSPTFANQNPGTFLGLLVCVKHSAGHEKPRIHNPEFMKLIVVIICFIPSLHRRCFIIPKSCDHCQDFNSNTSI
jgi:hypothetical protein